MLKTVEILNKDGVTIGKLVVGYLDMNRMDGFKLISNEDRMISGFDTSQPYVKIQMEE